MADRVSVSRYRYIDKLQTNRGTILQTSSEIQGTLPDNYRENLGHILFKLLPAGSITGAPKKKTMQITHAHIHLIPITKESDMYFGGKKLAVSQEELAEIAAKIRKEFK